MTKYYSADAHYRVTLYVLLAMASLGACTFLNTGPAPGAVRAIKNHNPGLTDVQIGGWSPLACGYDALSREFTATNQAGERVQGVICGGMFFKNYTVRW